MPRWANSPAAITQAVLPDAVIASRKAVKNRSTDSRTDGSLRLIAENDERIGTIVTALRCPCIGLQKRQLKLDRVLGQMGQIFCKNIPARAP